MAEASETPKRKRGRPMGRRHQEDIRLKIQASQLLELLTNHASGKKIIDDASRIKAAEILLKKALPDLSSIEHTQHEELPAEGTVLERVSAILKAQPGLKLVLWQQNTQEILSSPLGSEERLEGCLKPVLSAHVSFKRALLARLQADLAPPAEVDAALLKANSA